MTVKRELYNKHRVREYWIVDAGNRFVYAYRLAEDDRYPDEPVLYDKNTVLTSTVLEGFSVPLDELLAAE